MHFPDWKVYAVNGLIAMAFVLALGVLVSRNSNTRTPGRLQSAMELALTGLRDLFAGTIGHGGEKHLPLVIALFFYILVSNIMGQIPGLKSSTANLSATFGLAAIVFIYVQYIGIRSKGILGYLKHFLGPLPALALFFIFIELIGEFAKPFSLSMRLFGNIWAEDIINDLATNAGKNWFIPFQTPVYALQLFTDTIQAFIFPLLACAYIGVMSESHDDNGDEYDSRPHSQTLEEQFEDSAAGLGGRISTSAKSH